MKAATILAVLVALIALFAGASAEYFDFVASKAFVLSMQKCNAKADWTLHGLWPEWAQGCGNTFSEAALAPIRADLEKHWPSCPEFSSNGNIAFWKHEYTKHGSCMKNLTQLEYFSTGLELLDKFKGKCDAVKSGECRICLDMNLNPC